MTKNPSRPRFQFSLRTLLICVALLAVLFAYVGRQIKLVNERNALQRRWEDRRAMFLFSESNPPSWVRRLFGDKSACDIWIPACGNGEKEQIERIFPEAHIQVGGPPPIVD